MDELEQQTEPLTSFDVAIDAAGTATIKIGGELDISTVDDLAAHVASALAVDPPRLIVDVSELRFADSSAIALWVRWAATVERFELRDPPALLRRVITAMGLTEKLAIRP
ncbi:MAG: STAS domain-containing protein [Solirubrobacteraceae bacterium]|jgi:anti-anti-sigma factor